MVTESDLQHVLRLQYQSAIELKFFAMFMVGMSLIFTYLMNAEYLNGKTDFDIKSLIFPVFLLVCAGISYFLSKRTFENWLKNRNIINSRNVHFC